MEKGVYLRQELKQGRNLEAGADTEYTEGCCLLVCSRWLAQPALLYNPEPPAQGAGLSHVNHKSRKRHTDIPAGQSDEDDFSLEVALSSQVTLVCDKN